MDLQTFVRQSLVEISQAVRDANALVSTSEGKAFVLDSARDKNISPVEFDVAVTVASEDKLDAGFKLKIAVFEAKIGGDEKEKFERVSRVKFKVIIQHDIE